MDPTDQQQAIFDRLRTGNEWLVIDALAGSGKTSTLLHALPSCAQKSVIMTAFNKRTADELTGRLIGIPKVKGTFWGASTFHSAGLRMLTQRGKFDVKPEATEQLVNEAADTMAWSLKVSFKVRKAVTRLLRIFKETFSGPEIDINEVRSIATNYTAFTELTDEEIDQASNLIVRAYDLGMTLKRDAIDFCDMVWLPVVLDLQPKSRYQGVFVDELQDLSLVQYELIRKLVAPNGRVVGVGDKKQTLYSWKGGLGAEIFKMMTAQGASTMPLTTSFRCSQAVVKEANAIVPELRAWSGANIGSISYLPQGELAQSLIVTINSGGENLITMAKARTMFVLSRTNAPLLNVALDLYELNIEFVLLGFDEIVMPLINLVKKLDKSSRMRFIANLNTWHRVELARAEQQHSAGWSERIEDQFKALSTLVTRIDPHQLEGLLYDIGSVKESNITLSTTHKIKGLEADYVYLLRNTFARHQNRREPFPDEELWAEYVGITRSRNHLIWVESE